MTSSRALRLGLLAVWIGAGGCTTLREVPRADFATRSERKNVRTQTYDGLVYEFDYARFASDTLVGFRTRTDVEGPAEQVAVYAIPFDNLDRVATRQVNWRRTAVVGGTVAAAALWLGLRNQLKRDPTPNTSRAGKEFRP